MKLTTGKDGVVKMKNSHTSNVWDSMFIHRNLNLTGPITTVGNVINLGYNERIECDSADTANSLAMKIMDDLNR